MAGFNKELQVLLTNEVFNSLVNSEAVQLSQLNAVIALLIKSGIPFTLSFTQNTKNNPATAALTVSISSTASTSIALQITVEFDF